MSYKIITDNDENVFAVSAFVADGCRDGAGMCFAGGEKG